MRSQKARSSYSLFKKAVNTAFCFREHDWFILMENNLLYEMIVFGVNNKQVKWQIGSLWHLIKSKLNSISVASIYFRDFVTEMQLYKDIYGRIFYFAWCIIYCACCIVSGLTAAVLNINQGKLQL